MSRDFVNNAFSFLFCNDVVKDVSDNHQGREKCKLFSQWIYIFWSVLIRFCSVPVADVYIVIYAGESGPCCSDEGGSSSAAVAVAVLRSSVSPSAS